MSGSGQIRIQAGSTDFGSNRIGIHATKLFIRNHYYQLILGGRALCNRDHNVDCDLMKCLLVNVMKSFGYRASLPSG